MTDFWTRAKKLNTIQLINSDPLLSQFKHHFILLKVYLPRKMNLQTFVQKIPEGFGLPFNFSNSVYIAQFVNFEYDNDLVDIAIGFRRDETAIQIARQNRQFKHDNRASKVQLSSGFKIFMQQLRTQQQEQQKSNKDEYLNIASLKKSLSIRISKNQSQGNIDAKNIFQQNKNKF